MLHRLSFWEPTAKIQILVFFKQEEGLKSPRMGLGAAEVGYYLGSRSCYCASVQPCGHAEQFLSHDLACGI